jgi:hypothetical protein
VSPIKRVHGYTNVAGYLVPGSRVDSPLSPIPPRHSAVIKLIYESLVVSCAIGIGNMVFGPRRAVNRSAEEERRTGFNKRFHNVAGYLVPGSRVDSPLSPIPPRHSAVIKLIYGVVP